MKILFLYNNDISLSLYDWLSAQCKVVKYSDRIDVTYVQRVDVDLIISYNYKYKISKEIIQYMRGNVVNLHISFLPWNKGVSPNVWSFLEDTPKGVTIHYVDKEIDTGKIIIQRKVELSLENTLSETYQQLHEEIQDLFKTAFKKYEKWNNISFKQEGQGSYHSLSEYNQILPLITSWDMKVKELVYRYKIINNQGVE